MVFSSIVFLCIFFPAVIILYYLCPKWLRNFFLLLASLLFYAWGEPKYIVIMLFSTVFDYCNGRLLEYFVAKEKKRTLGRLVLIVSVVGNLGILCFFKYTDFVLTTINSMTGHDFRLLGLALPIGISFYTFQTMSYTIDVYRGNVQAQHNLISFGMYVCMFPQLIAGPIVRYSDVQQEVDTRQTSSLLCAAGMQRFLLGLGKKYCLLTRLGHYGMKSTDLAPQTFRCRLPGSVRLRLRSRFILTFLAILIWLLDSAKCSAFIFRKISSIHMNPKALPNFGAAGT